MAGPGLGDRMPGEAQLKMSVMVAAKVSLGNYSSANLEIFVSGVTVDTTDEEVAELIEAKGKLVYDKMKDVLRKRIKDAIDGGFRPENGGGHGD